LVHVDGGVRNAKQMSFHGGFVVWQGFVCFLFSVLALWFDSLITTMLLYLLNLILSV
jgi:alpha-glucuronidase